MHDRDEEHLLNELALICRQGQAACENNRGSARDGRYRRFLAELADRYRAAAGSFEREAGGRRPKARSHPSPHPSPHPSVEPGGTGFGALDRLNRRRSDAFQRALNSAPRHAIRELVYRHQRAIRQAYLHFTRSGRGRPELRSTS